MVPGLFQASGTVGPPFTLFCRRARKIKAPIKALGVARDKEAILRYGFADSGASLGGILGAALTARETKQGDKASKAKPAQTTGRLFIPACVAPGFVGLSREPSLGRRPLALQLGNEQPLAVARDARLHALISRKLESSEERFSQGRHPANLG